MTTTQQIVTVAVAVIATMLTRFTPFVVFRPGRPTPKYIMYLGKVLPASVFAMLVVYCLRGVSSGNAIAQFVGVLITVLVHVWRRNMMWSIAAGTLSYMALMRL